MNRLPNITDFLIGVSMGIFWATLLLINVRLDKDEVKESVFYIVVDEQIREDLSTHYNNGKAALYLNGKVKECGDLPKDLQYIWNLNNDHNESDLK